MEQTTKEPSTPTPVPASEDLQYISGLAKFKEIELNKWLLFKKDCKAHRSDGWVTSFCRVRNDDCQIYDCFAMQLIKFVRGYF